MHTLTDKERRAIKLNLKGFDKEKLRIIIDKSERKDMILLGLDCLDGKYMTRLVMPLKNQPDMARIKEQLKTITKNVYLKEADA